MAGYTPQHMAQRHAFGIVTFLVCALLAVLFAVPPVTERVTVPLVSFVTQTWDGWFQWMARLVP